MSALVEGPSVSPKPSAQKAQNPTQDKSTKKVKAQPETDYSKAFIGGVSVLFALTWMFIRPYNEEQADNLNRRLRREQGFTQEDEAWEKEEEIKTQQVKEKPKSQ